jgi:hypothetical protein
LSGCITGGYSRRVELCGVIIIIIIITVFSRLLMLSLIFLGIIINLLPLYTLSYFVLVLIFVYFYILVLNSLCVFIPSTMQQHT